MAEKELSILVRARGAAQAARDIGRVDSSVGRLARNAGAGLKVAAHNLAVIGAGVAVGLGAAVSSGIDSLTQLEDATTAVTGAIKATGHAGQESATQIAGWANQIEASIGAAFDDKDITKATATLIRFGKVTPSNLRPAMVVMTDLAAKTGDVDSAATLLAKALAAPEKAAGKLARAGIILTKGQQDQIKALVKAGKTAQAQKVILDSLAATTKGAAEASQGPYKKAQSELKDVTEDATRALAVGFLPVIEKVRDLLKGELAKPSTLANIREFGRTLAGGLSSLINIAKNLPWAAIGEGLKMAGAGAKAVLDAFVSLPPWVQTAVITGWGLNKLSGGFLGNIASTLASGLIKGVLGITAGVVNLKAGTVIGGGAGVPGGGSPGKGGSVLSAVGKVFLVGAAIGAFAELKGILDDVSAANRQQTADLKTQTQNYVQIAPNSEINASLSGLLAYQKQLNNSLSPEGLAYALNIDGVRDTIKSEIDTLIEAARENNRSSATQATAQHQADAAARAAMDKTRETLRSAIAGQTAATQSGLATTAAAARGAGAGVAAAIAAKNLSVAISTAVKVATAVTVSARAVAHTVTTNAIRSQALRNFD